MVPLQNILFLDIETVSQYASFEGLPDEWKELWTRKAEGLLRNRENQTVETVYERAAIYAEFGKIVCISCGVVQVTGTERKLLLKSFSGHDEKTLLSSFCDTISKWAQEGNKYLCAHNGKEFDFPYLCRRMVINEVCIPGMLAVSGKKPWEVNHIDTMELWKFGDFKSYTSLNLLACALGIKSPKDDIDGSMVGSIYWNTHDLSRIVHYCQKDVVTVAQVYLRLNNEPLILPENIEVR